ncbi:MAG TPA: anhydro-N-acetylmuramic acid kinase [Alphaproteobacteria bacterium]|nr:anhydro-N-acetylmuramic acid kinase [Alphaproteobacteria bacterium]
MSPGKGSDRVTAVGLMSGTSMDGVDAAVIRTDGESVVEVGAALTIPYRSGLRQKLQRLVMGGGEDRDGARTVGREITLVHIDAVHRLLAGAGMSAADVDVLGFHGHTIRHAPVERITVQIGDPFLLAQRTGITVVGHFRDADVAAGGQGAPLVPLYHAARATDLEKPLAILNIGGVANITWLGDVTNATWIAEDGTICAFDCGPGNALIDDFVAARTGRPYDASGTLGLAGTVNPEVLQRLLDHPFFDLPPPKSLDRNAFDLSPVDRLSTADGAATLAAFTVTAAVRSILRMGSPKRLLVSGGGRLNRALIAGLASGLEGTEVAPVEAVGWRGDALEAEAFGYLAVRSLKGLPLSVPSTTGVPEPMCGGVRYEAANRATVAS